MTLREARKTATRLSLSDAGLQLFMAKGFDATTMDEIAAGAGVSRATAFRYFPTKEALFFARQKARIAELQALLAASDGSKDSIREALLALARRYQAERDVVLAQERVIRGSRSLPAFDLQLSIEWEAVLASALDDGDHFRARVRAGALVGGMRAAINHWFDTDANTDLIALAHTTLDELGLSEETS